MYLKTFDELQKTSAFFMLKPAKAVYGFIITVCVSIVAVLIWASISPIDEVIRAEVLLRPTETVSSIKCVVSGELAEKNFKNDDFVQAGELLFSLDTAVYETELAAYKKEREKNLNEIFENQILLETMETEKKPAANTTSDAVIKSLAYITEFKRYQNLIEEAKIKLEREENAPPALKIPQNIEDLKLQLTRQELSFEAWKNSQKIQALEQKKQLQAANSSVESRISELERAVKNSTIYAPISGRVSEVKKVNVGDYILSGEEIARIIPQNSESLKAELYINPSHIARVKVGNPVKIKFPGLPPSRYGMTETEISLVPPDVSLNNSGQPVFIAEAVIHEPELKTKHAQTAMLIPGMTAEARIITDRSTVLQMILRKLDFMN